MINGWRQTRFADFLSVQRGHDLPEQDRVAGDVPILGSFGITGWHNQARAKGPGITIGRSGASFGTVAISGVDFWPLNTALYVTDFKGNDVRFCYYLLKTIDFAGYNSGSAQPSLNRNFIADIPLFVPAPHEQRAIATVLGALDDKIEANRRMNATLESLARALFKSWFVDFDPVRAKMKGCSPALAPDLAALFPNRLTESPLGLIPEGWKVSSIYDIANVIYGAPFASKHFNSDGVGLPLIRIRDLRDQNPALFTDEILPKAQRIQPGDLVVGMDGEFRPYLWSGPVAWLNQRVCTFVPKPPFGRTFVHHAIEPALLALENSKTATTVIHLGKSDIDQFKAIEPNIGVAEQFDQVAAPIDARIIELAKQSRTLAQLRDLLLPKLISGALRVRDAERMIGDAA